MDMPPQSLAFLLASIAGPATAVAAESPEMVFPATAAGVLMFVGAAIMKLSNTATAHLVEMRLQCLDQRGVGQLVRMGFEKGRSTKPDLKVGICGEHGGDPSSVAFCHEVGLNYVSCSPYRVPVARLAAAHAALSDGAIED